ncbi:MAG: galactose-1-epimerase [Firmicutes bacterium HGW-Firmicutes-16]|nr:MAG: galactose-1-epimerase [Firmicutes bacterium HGW-Firmicutes-16]
MIHYIFGYAKTGEAVTAYRLTNSKGANAVILDYGCIVQALSVPNAQGGFTDVVLGYDTVLEYEKNDAYLGAAIGRVANRIGQSEFTLNGKSYTLAQNDGENHLHGGIKGFDKHIWNAHEEGRMLSFTRLSPNGEENYPGNLEVCITYELSEENELIITYDADTDADTVVNLTNHSYFNLSGKGTALNHRLQVFAEEFTENDSACLPTGKLLKTAGTPFDFSKPKTVGSDIDLDDTQLRNGSGYDHNFVLSDKAELKKAAVLSSPDTGIRMTTFTTLPGVQLYSGNWLTPRAGKGGNSIDRRFAVCLETQVFPNALALPHFPSPILKKDGHYHTVTVYRFDTSIGTD